ncbi:hypothetical protein HHK36_003224 [Tetracentron sinense]|uniref:Ubiquitin-like domain-containing protein n=1 Tax=Tetracentron sinense TaxID=13715 RepID=A0A834ZX85_TETSI|nr:hypothetical protein HHK36_003224 [Tetracentron sinense]
MKVIILTLAGEFTLEVGLNEPVIEVKQKIEQLLGVPVALQTLAVYDWELMDGLDMEDFPIVVEGTKINLTITPIEQSMSFCNKVQITVKFSTRRINIEVERTETVKSLKEKIHIIEGTPIKRLSLFFSGIEMDEDYRNLCEYGIHEHSEIIVFLKSVSRQRSDPIPRMLNLVVQTSSSLLNSASIPLEMKESSTVNELRQLLLVRKVLPQDDYFFIHKQRIMRDNCSLCWHGVENGDSLYVFKGTISRGN